MNKFLKHIDIPIMGCLSSYLTWSFIRWEFWHPGWLEMHERGLFLACVIVSCCVYALLVKVPHP